MRRSIVRGTVSLVVLASCMALVPLHARGQEVGDQRVRYFIDPSHSSIEFSVPFMGIARVSGSFNQFYGTVEHDPSDPLASAAEVVMRVASIDTRNTSRDRDLLSESYFDAARFPVMIFRSRETFLREGEPVLVGDLTIRDTTREVELPFRILGTFEGEDGRQMGAEAATSLDRRDFGISKGQFSGDQVFIGNEVGIRLMLRLREPSPQKTQMSVDHPPTVVDPSRLQSFVGSYRYDERDFRLDVHLLGGELALERAGTLLRMIPIGAGRFRLQDFGAFVTFETSEEQGRKLVFERIGRVSETYIEAVE